MARTKGMGKIIKRGKYYHLITRINGKEVSKSLRVTTKSEADKKAKELLQETVKIEDKSDIRHFAAKSKKLINQNSFTMLMIWSYFHDNYFAGRNINKTTIDRYKYRLNMFLAWNSGNEDIRRPCNLSEEYINSYIAHLHTLNISANTLNNTIMNLKRIFDVIATPAGLENNYFGNVKKGNAKAQVVQKKSIKDDQIKPLFDTIDTMDIDNRAEYKLLFMLTTHTGARLIDCCLMKWDCINFKDNMITYKPHKTRKSSGITAKVPILDRLKPYLETAFSNKENNYLVPNIAALYNKSRKYVIRKTNTILIKAGIKNIEEEEAATPEGHNKVCLYGFHSARYYFITLCARNNIPVKMIMDAVGHSKDIMNFYYQQFDNNDRHKAFKSLDNSITSKRDRIILLLDNAKDKDLDFIIDYLEQISN